MAAFLIFCLYNFEGISQDRHASKGLPRVNQIAARFGPSAYLVGLTHFTLAQLFSHTCPERSSSSLSTLAQMVFLGFPRESILFQVQEKKQ